MPSASEVLSSGNGQFPEPAGEDMTRSSGEWRAHGNSMAPENRNHEGTVRRTSYGGQPQDLHQQKGHNNKIHFRRLLSGLKGHSYKAFSQRHVEHRRSAQERLAVRRRCAATFSPPRAGAAPRQPSQRPGRPVRRPRRHVATSHPPTLGFTTPILR